MIEMVDVYHPGEERPIPPFLLVSAGARSLIPAPPGTKWHFWKQVPINLIAVDVEQARRLIQTQGYYLQ